MKNRKRTPPKKKVFRYPSVRSAKITYTSVWPVSVRTDVCVDKHEVGVHALPIFRR